MSRGSPTTNKLYKLEQLKLLGKTIFLKLNVKDAIITSTQHNYECHRVQAKPKHEQIQTLKNSRHSFHNTVARIATLVSVFLNKTRHGEQQMIYW